VKNAPYSLSQHEAFQAFTPERSSDAAKILQEWQSRNITDSMSLSHPSPKCRYLAYSPSWVYWHWHSRSKTHHH